jgi:hypothetical protein
MKRLLSFFTLAGLALLLMAPLALAASGPDGGQGRWATAENGRMADNGEIVYRCGTDDHGRNAPDQAQIDRWIQDNRVMAGGVIPVNFHVITNGSTGSVSDAQIAAQIQVLNRNYAGLDYNGNPVSGASNTGYTFVLASTSRTSNRKWFTMTPGSRNESQAKAALVVNPTSSLNLYTASPGQNLLGWSTFPWNLASNPTMDGVVIHYASLPGGTLAPYNLGGTATHEVGHWVGLYHTFQGGCDGGNCSGAGDLVCDTPGEATSTSGCPTNKDTCAQAGLDPVHNYMDYSTDICYTNFTPGQDARADAMMANYRSAIGSARLADSELPITDFRAGEEHGPRMVDNGEIAYRCATPARGKKAVNVPSKEAIDRYIIDNRVAAGGVIPVNFHVIYNGSEGNVPESQLDQQIVVLNRNYAGQDYNGNPVAGASNTGYTFVKASVTRTNSRSWFKMTPGSRAESQAKNSLAVNWTSSLNLYTAKPGQNLLGWATFPQDISSNGKMDGVVIHYASLPGGTLSPYNLGGTATHEVGHWVGLYHTFQGGCGSDCATTGDLVCDTPGEATSTSGCPSGKDTCAGTGLDPIHNYMDYSTDICYTNFTPGQDARADFLMSTYRSLIGSARLANAAGSIQNARDLNGGLVRFAARPNPFNPRTKIEFGMAHEGRATVRVFDIRGRLVSTVVDKVLAAGNHSFDFDAAKLSSGVYFMRLQADGAEQVRRLSLLK